LANLREIAFDCVDEKATDANATDPSVTALLYDSRMSWLAFG
jgi:hypothetical protein